MRRLLLINLSLIFLVGTLGISVAQATTPAPQKKLAPPAKPIARAATTTTRAAAPAVRTTTQIARPTAAPAVASPAALQAAAMSGKSRAPASVMSASGGNGSKDISEELKIMGQSRNLSMGLLFQKDKDKLTFGTPRTNYEDKVSDKKANF